MMRRTVSVATGAMRELFDAHAEPERVDVSVMRFSAGSRSDGRDA